MGAGIPLTVERRWVDEHGVPALRFTLVNRSRTPVEIGALGTAPHAGYSAAII